MLYTGYFFIDATPTTVFYTLSLHDALPIYGARDGGAAQAGILARGSAFKSAMVYADLKSRSEEHTSELQSRRELVCRLLLEKKNLPRKLFQGHQRKRGQLGGSHLTNQDSPQ